MLQSAYYNFMRPALVALVAMGITGGLIYLVGQLLLNAHEVEVSKEFMRRDLWAGVVLTVAILAIAGLLSTVKQGKLGPLDEEIAIGSKPMFPVELDTLDPAEDLGNPGTIADLGEGYMLYAASGAIARSRNVLRSVEDLNETPRTLVYATGLNGVNDELWIPIEAVTTVYPQSKKAFLAIRGDELEHFGWHRPPESWVRKERPKETPLY